MSCIFHQPSTLRSRGSQLTQTVWRSSKDNKSISTQRNNLL